MQCSRLPGNSFAAATSEQFRKRIAELSQERKSFGKRFAAPRRNILSGCTEPTDPSVPSAVSAFATSSSTRETSSSVLVDTNVRFFANGLRKTRSLKRALSAREGAVSANLSSQCAALMGAARTEATPSGPSSLLTPARASRAADVECGVSPATLLVSHVNQAPTDQPAPGEQNGNTSSPKKVGENFAGHAT
jgi:hypothetical protein